MRLFCSAGRMLRASSSDAAISIALFHLNLAFSSIEEEQRGDVIAKCYWPLLDLAQTHGPVGIELTGFTLEEIAARDPEWIGRFRALVAGGKAELIGSGYAQIIGPLVPATVTEANLRIGNEKYERLLGLRPRLALVNEQAYSAGLVGLYLDAGYDAILMDWDNPSARSTPNGPAETRNRAAARCWVPMAAPSVLLWTNTVAFQKLQRFAHGDIEREVYLDYVRTNAAVQLVVRYVSTPVMRRSSISVRDVKQDRGRKSSQQRMELVSARCLRGSSHAEPGFANWLAPSRGLRRCVPGTSAPLRLESAAWSRCR